MRSRTLAPATSNVGFATVASSFLDTS
jgi:hypothetical protein